MTADDLSALRIAFVSGNYNCLRDGANRAQNKLVGYLLERGARVRVYSPTCDPPAFQPTGDLVSVPSWPMAFGRKEYRVAFGLPKQIRGDIAAFAPNLFHLSLPLFHGRSALRLAREMGVPAVAAMHTRFETYPRYYKLGFMEPWLTGKLIEFYQACDRVVAPSQDVAEAMEAQGMAQNIGVWTRGVDAEVFNPSGRDPAWRRAQGLRYDVPVIAFLGRLVAEKGLEDFARVIAHLRAAGDDFDVLVIGDGPARAEFEPRIGRAHFTGFLHGREIAQALANSDILLNPSSTEAFSNVSVEAMACGVPVVAADATGNRKLVLDGQTGLLVPPGDIAGYAAAIRRYLSDPQLRRDHAGRGHRRSREFTWDAANAAMAQTYLEAISQRSAKSASSPERRTSANRAAFAEA